MQRWRALLHRVIAKQQANKEQTHPVCLQAVEKYEKVENVIHRMILKQPVKNEKENRFVLCVL